MRSPFRWFENLRIKNKLILSYTFILLLVMIFIYSYFPAQQKQSVQREIQNRIVQLAESSALLLGVALNDGAYTVVTEIHQWLSQDKDFAFILVTDEAGEVFASFPADAKIPDTTKDPVSQLIYTSDLLRIKVPMNYKGKSLGHVTLGLQQKALQQTLDKIQNFSTLLLAGIFLLALMIVYLISTVINKPIRLLSESINRIIDQKGYEERVNVTTIDEVGQLASRFNDMISMIESRDLRLKETIQDLNTAKGIIEEKNEQIFSSIRYAKKIQTAILPPESYIKKILGPLLVFYKPKDIVSGDFYWIGESSGLLFVALVDCTGHGVPGAFMSMMGHTMLNKLVYDQHLTDPAQILENLSNEVYSTLRQEDSEAQSNDGMDVALVVINPGDKTLEFSGARRPLYWVRKGEESELIETKGTRRSIGGKQKKGTKNFIKHKLTSLDVGDTLYMTSDGYADQNSPDGPKYGSRQVKRMLERVASKSVEEQYKILENELIKFQSDEDQRDDITIIGIPMKFVIK